MWIITTIDGNVIECVDDDSLIVYLNNYIDTVSKIERCENCSVTMKKNYKGTTRIEEVLIELIAVDWNRRVDNGLSGSD